MNYEFMIKNNKYIIICLYLITLFVTPSCGTSKPGATYATVEQAEKARAKDKKAAQKLAKKKEKKAKKEFWKKQSKEARKRVKQTEKRHKREARKKRRNRSVF